MLITFKLGMLLGLSIIISIGAQNLFVIQQAMRNEYTYSSALTCFLCDIILILAGAAGLSAFFIEFPALKTSILILGILFLGWYGYKAIRRGFAANTIHIELQKMTTEAANITPLSKVILLGLSFSLLNPAAILDTIVIIGGSANHYTDMDKYLFVAGTITASFIWFFGLASISRYLAKRTFSQLVWRALDFISGGLMFGIAVSFLLQLI